MDSDDERSCLTAVLVITIALRILTAFVAVLVAIVPGGGDEEEPTSPGTSTSATTPTPGTSRPYGQAG